MAKKIKTQPEQTTAPTPEEVAQNQVAPDVPPVSTTEETTGVVSPPIEIESPTVEQTVTTTNTAGGEFTTITPVVKTEDVTASTGASETKVEYHVNLDTTNVVVNKDALYRMLVGLARGHTQSYTYERAKQMVGKLFGIEGAEFQAKWEEIKQFIG